MQNQNPENTCSGGVKQLSSARRFQTMTALIVSCALSALGFSCGGSDSEDEDAPINEDSGITAEAVPEGFVFIPGGKFKLKHNTIDHKSGSTLKLNAFALSKTPVTVEQYKKCVDVGECTVSTDLEQCWGNYTGTPERQDHPMNCIDVTGAQKYCEWIGGRLPLEEEWEYAATHNGTKALNTNYPWGDAAPAHCEKANYSVLGERDSPDTIPVLFCDENREETESGPGTSAVGLYSPAGDSPLGLVDMIGNVWEWTVSQKKSEDYILKGCSFDSVVRRKSECNVTDRRETSGEELESEFGFRCAM